MKPRFLILFALLGAALSAPLASRAGSETPVNSYDVVQVGGASMSGNGLNDAGHVVGGFYVGVDQHAFLWSNGALTDLGTLGGAESVAKAVNNLDQVVGRSYTPEWTTRAFLWSPGTGMQDLGTLGGSWSAAQAINDAGQVAGSSEDTAGIERATLWQNGQAYDLGVPDGYSSSTASGINAAGQVVGYLYDSVGEPRAFRWSPAMVNGTTGTMIVLHPGTGSYAYGLNSGGDTVGEAWSADRFTSWATLWDAAGAYSIPPLPWSYASTALAINASRTVVGYDSQDDGWDVFWLAYAWDASRGARRLDSLVNATGMVPLERANGVNASGQIVATSAGGAVFLLSPSAIPQRPANLGAVPEATRVTLTWSPSSGAEQYVLRRATVSGGPYTTLGSVAGTSFTDTAVTSGATYSYVVSAANTYGESGLSYQVTVTIPPAAPTNLTATAGKGKRKVELKWTQSTSPGVTHNRIYRSTASGGGYTLRATLSATTAYTDISVYSGVTYYYVVTAVTSAGRSSAFSNQASAIPR